MGDEHSGVDLRTLPVDLSELLLAAESHDAEMRTFIDRETGELVLVFETSFQIADEYVTSQSEAIEVSSELAEQLVDDNQLPAWQIDELADALKVALDSSGRYVPVEPRWSSEGFRDMQDFAWSLDDPTHRQHLERALGGKGSFRRFKNALDDLPKELRGEWFAFRDARAREDIVDWLRSIGIEPIDTPRHQKESK
ncbi:MAG TPA: UPF0158 family protein [Thermomicrobiales bacterium]|nr:UPF0158 family protein [Thermomicrobiales bacterium]